MGTGSGASGSKNTGSLGPGSRPNFLAEALLLGFENCSGALGDRNLGDALFLAGLTTDGSWAWLSALIVGSAFRWQARRGFRQISPWCCAVVWTADSQPGRSDSAPLVEGFASL